MSKNYFARNKDLLKEIHLSKNSYCWFDSPLDRNYDAIAVDTSRLSDSFVSFVITELEKKGITKTKDELVFRIMTYEHIPLSDDKKLKSRTVAGVGHLRVNFPPFKHYRWVNGEWKETARSHWKGNLSEGEFCQEHGRITDNLGWMFWLLVENYGEVHSWRNYSYRDIMKDTAIEQLVARGLLFDESRGENPFAFYTTVMRNCFIKVSNDEKKQQRIRDDLLIASGQAPSNTRQLEDELAQKFANEPPKAPMKRKPGRKPKAAAITEEEFELMD